MSLRWLKPYVPATLYVRAILILLLPVVTVTLVVSVIFIQRHFEGVTRQMTNTVSREIRLMLNSGLNAEELAGSDMARILNMEIRAVSQAEVPRKSAWNWYDFTGSHVAHGFRRQLRTFLAVDLPDDKQVRLFLETKDGPVLFEFSRRRASASNPHQLLVNMVVFAVLITVIAYIYLRKQIRPITRLAHAADAFGKGRHLPYRPSGAIEVKAAGQAFVDMRARIERQIEQRTLMLSGVSHDLRTPLTRLKLGLALLDGEDQELMLRDVEEMERLITGFLDFARGAQQGDMERVELIPFVQSIVEDAQRGGRPVTLREGAAEGIVSIHKDGMRRAVENLINNAVRYGTRAEISLVRTDGRFGIQVEDDGPGIPEDLHEEALKPFARLDSARNQNRGSGVGLGLAIATDVARGHGGSLKLASSERLGGLKAEICFG